MNALKRFAAVSLFLIVSVAVNAQAGQVAEAFTVSPLIGYHVFEGDQNTADDYSFGLAVGYNVSQRWGVEFDARYTQTQVVLPGLDDSDLDVWSFGLNALYHFNPKGQFVPYFLVGMGGMTFDAEDFHYDEDFMLNWGLGAKIFLSKSVALRLDARHIADLHSDRVFDHQNKSSDTDHNLIASAGLVWQFGGVTPTDAPLDSDGDGVTDDRDKCPGTAPGIAVDAVGCPPYQPKPKAVPAPAPPPEPAPVVDGDDDGDGVPNSRDRCPNTPKGVTVDENGCAIKFTLYLEFDFDKAEIRPEYAGKLGEAADFIGKYPDAKFLLSGHTDSIGTESYNVELSKRRATAVLDYLVANFSIDKARLLARGYGEAVPVADNGSEEGRQKNRRVEIFCCVVLPEE